MDTTTNYGSTQFEEANGIIGTVGKITFEKPMESIGTVGNNWGCFFWWNPPTEHMFPGCRRPSASWHQCCCCTSGWPQGICWEWLKILICGTCHMMSYVVLLIWWMSLVHTCLFLNHIDSNGVLVLHMFGQNLVSKMPSWGTNRSTERDGIAGHSWLEKHGRAVFFFRTFRQSCRFCWASVWERKYTGKTLILRIWVNYVSYSFYIFSAIGTPMIPARQLCCSLCPCAYKA